VKLIEKNGQVELVREQGNWILHRGQGFSPVQTLVATAAACSTYVYEDILNKQGIAYRIDQVDVDYERDLTRPAHPVAKITIHFTARVSRTNRVKAEKDLRLIARNCPVVQSLSPSIAVQETVTFVDPAEN
jgi:uncharacterized OsmC-like protein